MSEQADRSAAWQRHLKAGEQALRQGRHAEAEQQYLDALQIAEGFGPADPRLVESLTRLGLLYARPGRLPHGQGQTEPLLRRALAIQEQALGPDHPEVARCLANLAQLQTSRRPPWQQVDPGERLALLDRAMASLEHAKAPDRTLLHSTVSQISDLYQRCGREGEAEALLQRAAALWDRSGTREVGGGPAHPHALAPLAELGRLYQKQGRSAEAEAVLLRVLTLQQQALGPEHCGLAGCLRALTDFYHAAGRYAEAEACLLRQMKVSASSPNWRPSHYARDLAGLAELYFMQGRYSEAEEILRAALMEAVPEDRPAGCPDPARELYAALLKLTGRTGEAIEMELRGDLGIISPPHRKSDFQRQVVAPPPAPDEAPEFVWISSLIVGYVREESAEVRWQTTGDVPPVMTYRFGAGGGAGGSGDEPGRRDHALSLFLPGPGPWVSLQVFAPARGKADMMSVCWRPARAAAADGLPRIEVETHLRLLGQPSFAEAEVRLVNRGDGDALRVRLDRLTPAGGWELLSQRASSPPLPEPLEIGRIGAGGDGLLVLRLCRRRGAAPPGVALQGTYTDAAGVVSKLQGGW